MSKLPDVSGDECVKVLKKVGFSFIRQKGSHIIMRREEPYRKVVVLAYKEIPRGTLRSIIRQAGLSVDEFIELLSE
jgi:predicted RNA binding protein YcfA (HicA-like mRNA interferase family)